jgi:tripartite-type tricarboxylate transporter receptor subunit TctC
VKTEKQGMGGPGGNSRARRSARWTFVARAAALALAAVPSAAFAAADGYPTRPITMVVPFAAGGPTDAVGRVIARSMSATLGRQIVIENVTGGGGILGRAKTASASPDGYTLLLGGLGMSTSATLYRKLPYDPVNAFAPVGLFAKTPMVVIARKDMAAKDIGAFLDQIRTSKDRLNLGHGGLGSGSHICGLVLMSALQTKPTTIPYRGSGPAMLDLIAGHVDVLCDQTTTAVPPMRDGSVKGYAVTTKERVPMIPDLPTLEEAGLRDIGLDNWTGLFTTKGTPKPIVDKLAAALRAAISDPEINKKLAEFGAVRENPDTVTPEAFGAFFRADVEKWAPIIKADGTYAD